MYVRLSAWTTRLPLDEFSWNLILEYFSKICRENSKFHWNLTRITGTLHEDQYTFLSYRTQLFVEWEMFQAKVVQKVKTHNLRSATSPPPRKSCRLWDKVGKMLSVGVAAEDNMAHAHFTLDTEGYKHTLRICNIYYFSQQWLHECASCCVKRTSVLFITSLCTNTQRIKSPKLLILRGFTIKTLHILPTSQGVPKFRPISIFISSPKQ